MGLVPAIHKLIILELDLFLNVRLGISVAVSVLSFPIFPEFFRLGGNGTKILYLRYKG